VPKLNKQTSEERIQQQRRQWIAKQKATEQAKLRLANEGIQYPIFNASEPLDDYYDKLQAYATKEAAYIVEALRQPSGPRPIIEYPKDEFKPYKDD
jgi:hypothetical protein